MRKLLLTAVLATLAFAVVGTSAAQAALEARDGTTGQLCSNITVTGATVTGSSVTGDTSAHSTVTGGCLIEDMEGTFNLMSSPYSIYDNCTGSYDIRIDGSAQVSYAVNQQVDCYWTGRTECTNQHDETIPWTYSSPNLMPLCVQTAGSSGGGGYGVLPVTWAYSWSGGRLVSMTQNNTGIGVASATFTNEGTINEVVITSN